MKQFCDNCGSRITYTNIMHRVTLRCAVSWCKKRQKGKFFHGLRTEEDNFNIVSDKALDRGWIDHDGYWFCKKHSGFQFNKDYVKNEIRPGL